MFRCIIDKKFMYMSMCIISKEKGRCGEEKGGKIIGILHLL